MREATFIIFKQSILHEKRLRVRFTERKTYTRTQIKRADMLKETKMSLLLNMNLINNY